MERIVAGGKTSDNFIIVKRSNDGDKISHLLELVIVIPRQQGPYNPIAAIMLQARTIPNANEPPSFECFAIPHIPHHAVEFNPKHTENLLGRCTAQMLRGSPGDNFLTQSGVRYPNMHPIITPEKGVDGLHKLGLIIPTSLYSATKEFERIIIENPSILEKPPESQAALLKPAIQLAHTGTVRQVS